MPSPFRERRYPRRSLHPIRSFSPRSDSVSDPSVD
jgi:hypothetical protein